MKISIVIATHNEATYLPRVIPTLTNQTYPSKNYEILFADGNSHDTTCDIIRDWQKKSKVKITLLHNQHGDSGSGRNLAIRKSKGKYIMQLSGHTLVAPNLLAVLSEKLDKAPSDVAGVGCRHKDPADSTDFQKAVGKILYSKIGAFGTSQLQSDSDSYVESVSFTLYKKKALLGVGLNDPKFKIGQDAELNIRLRKKGYKLIYTPKTYVEQYKRASYRGLARQMFWYGWARTKMLRKHTGTFKAIYMAPAIMVMFFLILLFSMSHIPFGRYIFFTGIIVYGTPLVYSSITLSKNAVEGGAMLLGYFVMHFSYGLGFLWGLVK